MNIDGNAYCCAIAKILILFLAILVIASVSFWGAKTLSYNFFYEERVKQTIREMVHPAALN